VSTSPDDGRGVVRIAAVGDLHFGTDSAGTWAPHARHLAEAADLLLLAGDLTRVGRVDEAAVLAAELADVAVPVVAVLGNHDLHSGSGEQVVDTLAAAGVVVLEGEATVVAVDGHRVGIAGSKGFGGGFADGHASAFGEPEMKAFADHAAGTARRFGTALDALDALDVDWRIGLLHYAPVEDTVIGERPDIYPFLGSYLLAEVADRAHADLLVHGHAHHGRERGLTPGGVHVRNVAQPVIRRSYAVYCLGDDATEPGCDGTAH
jgi:Icc-related predicted phosphoesterase